MLAARLNKIKPSPTIAVTTKAKELRAQGKDIIGLGAGEPDFDTHDNIKKAAIKAIHDGHTKYTAVDGIVELKKAIQAKFKQENNLDFALSEITVGTGGKQVLYNAFMASLNPEDEVIIPAPYWVSYPDMVLLAEGKAVIVDCPKENNFKLTAQQLEANITAKTKWLILNSPSNPTGASYSYTELEEIAAVVRKYQHVNIISDDIYEHITYDNFKFYTIANIAPDLKNRILTVNGVSKAYAMTGWRIGYAAGPSKLIQAMAKIQSQSTSNPTSISQYAALEALNGEQEYLKSRKEAFLKRRNLVLEKFSEIAGLEPYKAEGAFYIFCSCKDLIGRKDPNGNIIKDCTDFASYLLEEALVAVVPGIAFGMKNYFRVSYATSNENLENACVRIKNACARLS
jgi:aspartate aminotransferase